ncbi:MAG: hypothetical protein DLM72_14070 [Candidatus Nitrosopolaris wilkensis]|nr:MAG: hypothetical protein DLM72_14070 [Candidatus Nitrosopolaris wilkensis]
MTPKNKQALLTKPFIIIMVTAVVAIMTSATVASIVSAQQPQTSGSKFGTVASLQNGKDGKPAWIVSGAWDFKNVNSTSSAFNATFNMVMLNGSAPHKHTITDFKITGSPTKNNIASTYNGTATVTLKKGPVTGVPISIKLMGPSAMSLWIDPSKTGSHFGNTPLYGVQHRVK